MALSRFHAAHTLATVAEPMVATDGNNYASLLTPAGLAIRGKPSPPPGPLAVANDIAGKQCTDRSIVAGFVAMGRRSLLHPGATSRCVRWRR